MSIMDSGYFCMAGASLEALQAYLAWQVQHLEHLHRGPQKTLLCAPSCFVWQAQHLEHLWLVLPGKRSTWSTFSRVRGRPATIEALVAPPACFAWQAQHLEHLSVILRGRGSTWSTFIEVRRSPATIEYHGRRLLCVPSAAPWSTSGSFCVAGAALGVPS